MAQVKKLASKNYILRGLLKMLFRNGNDFKKTNMHYGIMARHIDLTCSVDTYFHLYVHVLLPMYMYRFMFELFRKILRFLSFYYAYQL